MCLWLRRSVLAVLLVAASAESASAQFFDIIDWLGQLSGPGFWGHSADIPFVCVRQDGEVQPLDCIPLDAENRRLQAADRKVVIGLRVGTYGSGKTGGYYRNRNGLSYPHGVSDSDMDINLVVVGPFVSWHVRPWLDIVAAVEFNRFSGPLIKEIDEPFWANSIQPSIVWKPAAHRSDSRRARAFSVVLGFKQYLETLEPQKFGAESGFESGKEGVWRLAARVDWLALLKR